MTEERYNFEVASVAGATVPSHDNYFSIKSFNYPPLTYSVGTVHTLPEDKYYGGSIQPLEFMQASMSKEEFIGFLKGNVIKYVSRAGKKDDAKEDLRKASRYLNWLRDVTDGKIVNPRIDPS